MVKIKLQSGIFERNRIISNILLIILLAGDLYFSVQYVYNLRHQFPVVDEGQKELSRIRNANFLKLFIDKVIRTNDKVSYEDRLKLETSVRQIQSLDVMEKWKIFVSSKDTRDVEAAAIDLMFVLAGGTVR